MKNLWLCCFLLYAGITGNTCHTATAATESGSVVSEDVGVGVGAVYYGVNAAADDNPHHYLLHTRDENNDDDNDDNDTHDTHDKHVIRHFTNMEVLLQLATNKNVFNYLHNHLETLLTTTTTTATCAAEDTKTCSTCNEAACEVDNNNNKLLYDHATNIMQAIAELSFDPNLEFQLTSILDSFFTDHAGNPVQDADYAFVQLVGPNGPYYNDNVRLGVSYQGQGLTYLGHHHVAQELYVVLGGSAMWSTDMQPGYSFRNVSFHQSNEHHAMTTPPHPHGPALFFWSWTGDVELDIKHSPSDVQDQLAGD